MAYTRGAPTATRQGLALRDELSNLWPFRLGCLTSYGRNSSRRMRYCRQGQILALAVESVVEIAEQILLTQLGQHVRAYQGEHRLRMHVRQQQERPIMLAAAG